MFATRRSFDVIKHKAIMTHTFDADKFCLGTLCKQGHEYENTGFSLRYKRNGKGAKGNDCVECSKQRAAAHRCKHREKINAANRQNYYSNREQRLQQVKEYRQKNLEEIRVKNAVRRSKPENRERQKQYHKRYRQVNKDKLLQAKRDYRLKNLQRVAQSIKRWKQTTKGRVSIKISCHKRRSLLANADSFTVFEWETQLERFDHACAYCGCESELTVDHVIPIIKGGCNLIWNVVPACARCNLSKNKSDLSEWYKLQSFYDEDREFWVNYWTGQDYQE